MRHMTDSSVKVALRVRPLSDREIDEGCASCLSYPADRSQIMIGKDKLFAYDFVFDENTSQECVYTKTASSMIDTVLQGYNATLLAYGQTGSGKTYTMGTCDFQTLTNPEVGIVPRMVRDIFTRMQSYSFEYSVRVSYLEIYKEDIHDLLSDDISVSLPIREDNLIIKIPGLTECTVNSCDEVLELLRMGSTKRTVGGTAMNQHSSRSHAVFTLHFLIRPKQPHPSSTSNETQTTDSEPICEAETLTSKLHLVDLAGSERQKKTHAEGDRLKEGITINRGLLALGNVISALCEKDTKKRSHIPYRDSRLTRLLQDSLGGNSATLMIACVSPADSNMEETLNTLRYADRARQIKNKPVLNRADPKDAELARLRALVVQLQARLNRSTQAFVINPCVDSPKPLATAFSSTMLSEMVEKTKKLERELCLLTTESDRLTEENAEMYKKLFDTEALCETILAELKQLGRNFSALKSSLQTDGDPDENVVSCLSAVQEILDRLTGLKAVDKVELVNQKIEAAYEGCKLDPETSLAHSTGQDDENAEKENVPISTDMLDRRSSELRARRLVFKERMETIESHLRQKHALLESLEQAASQGDDAYNKLLEQYEHQVRDLEQRIASLEQERAKLMSEQRKSNDAAKENQLKAMESELRNARQQLAELARLRKAKEARESECLRLRGEIQSLKVSMVRTAKQLKDESVAYRRWRVEKEREIRRLQQHDQRLQVELSQMASTHERQQAVLKRRIEAAAATEKRLKEMLSLQRDRRYEKKTTENATMLSKHDLLARVRSWITADLDMQVGIGEARHHLTQLIESRRTLCEQLRNMEAATSADDKAAAEVAHLNELIRSQTQQITELQQKLLDLGDRASMDGGSGSLDQSINVRLAQLHNIQEARTALKILFKETVSTKVQQLASDDNVTDLQLRLEARNNEYDQLRQRAVEFSASLAESEQQVTELRQSLQEAQENSDRLREELKQLQQRNASLEEKLKKQAHLYVMDPTGGVRRLSGTPLFSEKRRITRQSAHLMRKRPASPHVLVPDSTKKAGHIWDVFDEADAPTDSSLQDPTWRLSDVSGDRTPELRQFNKHPRLTVRLAAPHCKCKGACTNRCSCRKSGLSCSAVACKCITNKCQNRGNPSSPLTVQPTLEPIRETRPASPPVHKSSSNAELNTTFVIPREPIRTAERAKSTYSPTLSPDLNVKRLWPKNRPSYFPSPSLRPDV